jgi:hypothetical protein
LSILACASSRPHHFLLLTTFSFSPDLHQHPPHTTTQQQAAARPLSDDDDDAAARAADAAGGVRIAAAAATGPALGVGASSFGASSRYWIQAAS